MDLLSKPTLRLWEYDCQKEKYDHRRVSDVERPSWGREQPELLQQLLVTKLYFLVVAHKSWKQQACFKPRFFFFFFPRSRETNTSLSKMIARTKFELMMDRYPREWVSEDTCQCYCWQVLGGVDSFIWDLVPNQALRSFKNMTPTLNALLLIKLRSFQRTLSNAEYLDFWESLS